MSYEYQSIETLIDGVTGTTGFLSSLISRKSGLVFLLIVFGAIASKILFG
jgi:hypothetical protein